MQLKSRPIDYDDVSRIYDKVRAGDPEMVHQILLDAEIGSNSLVLDVGCGTGNNTLLFAYTSNVRMVGSDLSKGMLLQAATKTSLIPFVQSSAEILPFFDNTFDLVFMTEVIHHLKDVQSALKEIQRILKPGCRFCVATQSHKQIEDRMTSRFFPGTVAIDQARYPNIDLIEKMMRKAGFNDIWWKTRKFTPVQLGEEYVNTVSRRGYSMLHKVNDDEYEHGLSKLKDAYAKGEKLDYSAGYTFVWGIKLVGT